MLPRGRWRGTVGLEESDILPHYAAKAIVIVRQHMYLTLLNLVLVPKSEDESGADLLAYWLLRGRS